ncbi:hypothetical protein T12_5862 [Trichinella patagoniensis]|uniref:Uncharacterized protein n=1 Tax=Trichinella patagoniensis TaxID=990121 RepID=A0A0V0YZT3_9BILA|nr:hypothetical protein T12_5862 [Trichinella patagoniensis]
MSPGRMLTRPEGDPFLFGTVPETTRRSNSLRKASRDLVWKFDNPRVHTGLRGKFGTNSSEGGGSVAMVPEHQMCFYRQKDFQRTISLKSETYFDVNIQKSPMPVPAK